MTTREKQIQLADKLLVLSRKVSQIKENFYMLVSTANCGQILDYTDTNPAEYLSHSVHALREASYKLKHND